METKKCCISFGKFNKKYCYLILGVIITQLILVFLIVQFTVYSRDKNINHFNIINFMSYIFFTSLCESFMIIPDLILKKRVESENSKIQKSLKNSEAPKSNISSPKKSKNFSIKYIFNKKTMKFSILEKISFVSAGLLKLFLDIMFILYHYLLYYLEQNYNFVKIISYSFQFKLIFLFLTSKLMYNIRYYRHQNFSIIIIVLAGFAKFIFNCIQNYNKIFINIFIIFFIHLIHSFLESFLIVYLKGLMEYKYISPYKACYIIGLINFSIITIIYLIVSFCPCNKALCLVEYNDKKYFGNFLTIFDIYGLFMFLFFLIKTILLVLNYIIIHEFTVCHSFLFLQIFYLLEIGYLISKTDSLYKIISILIFSFINIFFILLFLEFIEINICKISYNTKKNIESRAIDDKEYYAITNEDIEEEDEIDGETLKDTTNNN